jgi:hypothetical protein
MKKLTILLFACAAALSMKAADNTLTDAEKADGWKSLFDGKTMNHWRNFKAEGVNAKWSVKDGAMQLAGRGGGDIITKEQFENFDFQMEWKISEGGNSGIFILADEKGKKVYSHAPEIQILDNERHRDRMKPTHRSGSLYDMIASPESSFKKAGEWNQVRILLDKGNLQVWQNGVSTCKLKINGEKWVTLRNKSKFAKWPGFGLNKKGHIGLQDHGNLVFFKKIKIKTLD